MLISVHLPKTAGASLRAALEEHFGDRLLWDYGDYPVNASTFGRNTRALRDCFKNARGGSELQQFACIHGHFMPVKYRLLPMQSKKRYVTWMRDPIERLASHYYYWVEHYEHEVVGKLQRRVLDENWSLERFCLGPELRNIYSKFLFFFPLADFDFIGITEFYDTDMEYFSRNILDVDLPVKRVNVNPLRKKTAYVEDLLLRKKIERHHAADMTLYRRALDLRQIRLSHQSND